MTSVYVKDASSKCSLSSINEIDNNSASIYLMKKAVFGIPRVATVLWEVLQELVWEDFFEGVFDGINSQSLAEAASVLASAISPYFCSLLKVVWSAEDCTCAEDSEMPVTSNELDVSSNGQNDIGEGGMTQSANLSAQQCADLNAHNIYQLPTIVYHTCHEEENVDDFLLRNAHIIDDYLDNAGDIIDHECHDEVTIKEPSECSWVMVPQDPKEDTITILADLFQAGEEEMSQEGDSLHVLQYRHMFHCDCTDTLTSEENSSDKCTISWFPRCPRCTKAPPDATSQEENSDKCAEEP